MKQQIKPKYNIGDLVCNGEGIVVKIHEKADYNEAFYLVHFIQTELEQWVRERSIDFTLQQQYTMLVEEIIDKARKRDEVQNHYDEQVLSES